MIKEKTIYHEGREVIQLNRIRRHAIDATCLQTCKQFLKFGSPLLYSKNVFSFYSSESYINLRRSWIEGDIHNPKYELPELNQLHEWPQAIPYVMDQIRRRVPLKQLPGWVYHDCFLRFLYIIRPHNAAPIKTLMFNLIVSEHWCHANSEGMYPECRGCRFPRMCIYIHFINEFSPGVTQIILNMDDKFVADSDQSSPAREKQYEAAITPFWKDQVRELKYVKYLALRSKDTGGDFLPAREFLPGS